MGNTAGASGSTVSGGLNNVITPTVAYGASIGGGYGNKASHQYAVVGGGLANGASQDASTVAGGAGNHADALNATVGGGNDNYATGAYATVPGGRRNTAGADFSFAAGYQAKAKHQGTFVWGDSTNADVASTATNQFIVRAAGGIWLGRTSSPSILAGHFLDTSTGGYLSSGGTWTNNSDRDSKENLTPVNGREILQRLVDVPISSWNYKSEDPSIRHIGPVAQDFAAFGVGADDQSISTVDADGVSLAAIQGLYELSQEQAGRIQELEAQNASLEQRLAALEALVGKLVAEQARSGQ